MRAIFMGTDRFAVPSLKAIVNSDIELVCVITQPDQPKGRGLKTIPSPVKEFSIKNSLMLYQPRKVRDREFIDGVIVELKPDVIVVAAFGQILPKAILDLPPFGCINLHPSLLPKYRGAAPIQRAIMNGEEETGVTVMFMDEGEDTGDIILQERIGIDISDSAEILSQKLSGLAAQMLLKVLQMAPKLPRQPQDNSKASFAPKLNKEDGLIDWRKSALEIHNLIRGTIPWPGAYTFFGDKQIKILESRVSALLQISRPPGTVIEIIPDAGIVVATGSIGLLVTTVQPANKSKMAARDFVNGYRIKIGDRFLL